MEKVVVWALAISTLAGCGSGGISAAELGTKCMRLCARNVSVCASTVDCSHDCAVSSQPTVCVNESAALFDCEYGLNDRDLCSRADIACASEETALNACFTAVGHPDTGVHPDTGATADTGAP